ncbi:LAFE_0F08152g1_1 [Lachancea fermentati]|uniref:LAFE_0F08152g1_1 n=1 Tax=Lachancea fermentati TaxID=4955 RepID=A0A1G4MF13_LACFM|nr:LAFE_0F08152g1_1 [Lachancea fermentati]
MRAQEPSCSGRRCRAGASHCDAPGRSVTRAKRGGGGFLLGHPRFSHGVSTGTEGKGGRYFCRCESGAPARAARSCRGGSRAKHKSRRAGFEKRARETGRSSVTSHGGCGPAVTIGCCTSAGRPNVERAVECGHWTVQSATPCEMELTLQARRKTALT